MELDQAAYRQRVAVPPSPWMGLRRAVAALVLALYLALAALPAFAHDDDEGPPPPPTPAAQAAAGRMTIAVLSLVTGVGVYYLVQRHRMMNGGEHPPEWDRRMNRSSVLLAVVSMILVWGVCTALSRPPAPAGAKPPGPIKF